MEKLVSIIVPIYNVEKYLDRCVKSIFAQSYTNLEIILIDDGSPDNCPALCDVYKENDKRVQVIHNQNGGLSSARNAGIDVAKGEYLVFIDADDWIDCKFIEMLYNACEQGAEVAECDYMRISNDNDKAIYSDEIVCKSGQELYNDDKYYFAIRSVVAWNKMYSRRCFQNVRYDVGKISEDVFTTYKLVYPCKKVALLSSKLYYYFVNDSGIINNFSIKRLDSLDAYAEQYQYFIAKGEAKVANFVIKKLYELINYFYALSLRSGVNERKLIKTKLKSYYKNFYNEFKNTVAVKGLEKILFMLSCGRLGIMKPLALHRKKRIA